MSETYLVGSANRHTLSVYHTDPDCRNLAQNAREVDADHVARRDLRECRVCAGETDTDRSDMRRALRYKLAAGEVDG